MPLCMPSSFVHPENRDAVIDVYLRFLLCDVSPLAECSMVVKVGFPPSPAPCRNVHPSRASVSLKFGDHHV